ncbi:hypothetical protein EDC47_10853 [Raoultella planticola]|nr:hypothetical protein EDC47_10853 [Raoultella planticola]
MWILKISHVNGHKFTDGSKNLYCYLRGFDRAFPSYAKIGDVFGITPRAAEERVKKLLEMGLIIKDLRPGTSNLYQVLEIPREESPEIQPTSLEVHESAPATTPAPEPIKTAEEKPDDDVIIDAVCELLSKPDSLRQQNRGDTFINYARRVMQSNHKKLPSRFEEELEMRFENRYPHFHERFGTPF